MSKSGAVSKRGTSTLNKLMVAIDSWENSTWIWKKWANVNIVNREKKRKKYLNSGSAKCTIYFTILVNGLIWGQTVHFIIFKIKIEKKW